MKIIAELNRRLRVVADERQWIIQTRKGRTTAKSSGWRSLRFVTTKQSLAASLKLMLGARYHTSLVTWVDGLPDLLPRQSPSEWSASFMRPTGLPILPELENGLADVPESRCEQLRSVG